MDTKSPKDEYDARQPQYRRLEEEALFILKEKLKPIRIHYTASSRIKTWTSFSEKVQRKQIEKPFDEIHDIVGLRIVCLFLSDIDKVAGIIRDSFSVVLEDNKIDGYDVASFGYMSAHFVVCMKDEFSGPVTIA